MTFIFNQPDSLQPLPENDGHKDKKDHLKSTDENPESEDDVFPKFVGEEFASQEEVAEAIEQLFNSNKNFTTEMVKYAERKIFEIVGNKIKRDFSPEDFVSEAIKRILTMDRKWYRNRVPEIKYLIMMVIVSLIRIEAKKLPDAENQFYNPIEEGSNKHKTSKSYKNIKIIPLEFYKQDNDDKQDNTIADLERYRTFGRSKAEDSFDFENIDEEKTIIQFEKDFESDPVTYYVFQEMLNGDISNINIAAEYGIEVKDVENAKKRINRKVKSLLKLNK